MLDNLIRSLVVVAEAEKEKWDETPDFKAKMKLYRVEVLVQEYFAKLPSVNVPEEEIETLLKENPALLPKVTLQLKEILVKTDKEADAIYDRAEEGSRLLENRSGQVKIRDESKRRQHAGRSRGECFRSRWRRWPSA